MPSEIRYSRATVGAPTMRQSSTLAAIFEEKYRPCPLPWLRKNRSRSTKFPVAKPRPRLRVWPAVAIAVAYWVAIATITRLDMVISQTFFATVIASFVTGMVFMLWLYSRLAALPGKDRLILLAALIIASAVVIALGDPSVGPMGLIFAGPGILCTAAAVWLLIARKWSTTVIRNGLLVVLALVWGQFLAVRINGIDGRQSASISGRWQKTAEELYLAEHASTAAPAPGNAVTADQHPLTLASGDWHDFRGENRQGELHGVKISTDWKACAAEALVEAAHRSRLVVVRGAGRSVVHAGAARQRRSRRLPRRGHRQGAVGPPQRWSLLRRSGRRGPPVESRFRRRSDLHNGRHGRGELPRRGNGQASLVQGRCQRGGSQGPNVGLFQLAARDQRHGHRLRGWTGDKGLLAYRTKDGQLAWSAATGPISYSSAQLVKFGTETQVLFLSDDGLIAIDPATGKQRWSYDAPGHQMLARCPAATDRRLGHSLRLRGLGRRGST